MKKLTTLSRFAFAAVAAMALLPAQAQFKIVNECYPTTTKSIGGVSTFEREKYVNIGGSSKEAKKAFTPEQTDRFLNDLDVYFGRALGLVNTSYRWGKSVREDRKRKGYVDLKFLKETCASTVNDNGLEDYKAKYGKNENLALHENHNAYPPFMPQYQKEGAKDKFPENNEAAAEVTANLLKYNYTDYTRPKFFEPINEPDWRYYGEQKFADLHLEIKKQVDKMKINTMVGGPCFSVSNFYNNEYRSKSLYTFIDNTNNKLDFYSFHSYDYYRWNEETKEFEGSINSGTSLEGVLDAMSAHTFNKYGKESKYLTSEHGGYNGDKENLKAAEDYYANKYFPGEGFEYEMKRRSISDFLMLSSAISNTMVYMNHPHIVLKAVPFILVETSGWNVRYYSSMLVKENFDKQSPNFVESKLTYFYEFFKDVKGEMIHSWCNGIDIQHNAYKDGNKLALVYHNQSNEQGEIDLQLKEFDGKVKSATIRRLSRGEDKTPYLSEKPISDLSKIAVGSQESIVILVELDDAKTKSTLVEKPYYSKVQNVQFKGSHAFTVDVPSSSSVNDAFLRVGINRKNNISEGITIKVNGTTLESKLESSAPRFSSEKNGYNTTRIIRIPKSVLKDQNNVEVSFADGGAGGVGAVVIRTLASK